MLSKKMMFGFGLLLLPFVSAYSSILGYYSNPVDLLSNSEWMRFLLVFGIFFALIFYSIKSMFKGRKNRGIAVVVSVCISLLITIAFAQNGLFYGFFGSDFSGWLILLAFILVLLFVIRAAYTNFGPKFTAFAILFIWFVLTFYFNPSMIASSGSSSAISFAIYSFITSWIGGILTFIIALALFFKKGKGHHSHHGGHGGGFWGRDRDHMYGYPDD